MLTQSIRRHGFHWLVIAGALALIVGMLSITARADTSKNPADTPNNQGMSKASDVGIMTWWPGGIDPFDGVHINNGTIMLGVRPEAHLGVDGGVPATDNVDPTTVVGVRYLPTNGEATAQGCVCEGWGVADAGTGESGWADVYSGGTSNLTVNSFTYTSSTAKSVVTAFGRLRVTHDFHPIAATPNLYEVKVTIKNISNTPVTDLRYTRVMDWDISPDAFYEFTTIQGVGSAANLLYADDNGFQTPDPLVARWPWLAAGNQVDTGPTDHGALFDFGFGSLAPGASRSFRIFYGGADNEAQALSALAAVGAEAYSLGQPGNYDPTIGAPNTFIFAFSGVGGTPLTLCNGLVATIVGTAGNDTITGTVYDDVIHGLGGNDTIDGLGGDDVICGGPGNDILRGGDGNDTLLGEDGADTLEGGAGDDKLDGGNGNDILRGGADNDSLVGAGGTDTADYSLAAGPIMASLLMGIGVGEGLDTLATVENLTGSPSNDALIGNSGPNVLRGLGGNDYLSGEGGNDTLQGGNGDYDMLYGGGGDDAMDGGVGTADMCSGGTHVAGDTAINCESVLGVP